MDARKIALRILKEKKELATKELSREANVSRQHASAVLNDLLREGRVIRVGSGPRILYITPEHNKISEVRFEEQFKTHGLKEHEVLDEARQTLYFLKKLPENVRSIFDYAFSEMVNNSIEHSQSKSVEVHVGQEQGFLSFIVQDYGIGVFRNVMNTRKLHSELEAIQDLLKGKTTTQPKAHSGEGIFFTSKIADIFVLESFEYRLRIDNIVQDVFIEKVEQSAKGTKVIFRINKESKKHLGNLFREYQTSASALGFGKTEVKVKLYTMGTIYISRSQARRVLAGLEEFQSIILDFDKVPTIGQAFADEIFRVFQGKYPKKVITPINANETVQFMIDRVAKGEA